MSSAIKVIDRRSSTGYVNNYGSNTLVAAATRTSDRKTIPMQDRDTRNNITSHGRRVLMTLARWLFWNFPAIRGAVLEQANLAVGTFVPQFYGANRVWGNQAEEFLYEWDKILDFNGWPYDGNTYRENLVIHSLVDGDIYTLLTENQEGYPLIQTHAAHRIGSRTSDSTVANSGWADGYALMDGVILDEFGRVQGYRYIANPYDYATQIDIPAANIFPTFYPDQCDLYRGYSGLASCIFDCQDVKETREFEKLAQKIAASIALIEKNETGEANPISSIIKTSTASTDVDGNAQSLYQETIDGGMIRYFRANSGSGLESITANRPTADQQAFEDRIMQSAMAGMEWSKDFSLDPSKVGGAQMRVVIEKINRVLEKRQRMVAKTMRRVHGYAISKAIKIGLLPFDPDWWKFEYQGPGELTADKKYDSDVDIAEIRAGLTTKRIGCARRGLDEEKVENDNYQAADRKLKRAGQLAKDHGITIQEALTVLEPPTPNGMIAPTQKPEKDPAAKDNQQ